MTGYFLIALIGLGSIGAILFPLYERRRRRRTAALRLQDWQKLRHRTRMLIPRASSGSPDAIHQLRDYVCQLEEFGRDNVLLQQARGAIEDGKSQHYCLELLELLKTWREEVNLSGDLFERLSSLYVYVKQFDISLPRRQQEWLEQKHGHTYQNALAELKHALSELETRARTNREARQYLRFILTEPHHRETRTTTQLRFPPDFNLWVAKQEASPRLADFAPQPKATPDQLRHRALRVLFQWDGHDELARQAEIKLLLAHAYAFQDAADGIGYTLLTRLTDYLEQSWGQRVNTPLTSSSGI